MECEHCKIVLPVFVSLDDISIRFRDGRRLETEDANARCSGCALPRGNPKELYAKTLISKYTMRQMIKEGKRRHSKPSPGKEAAKTVGYTILAPFFNIGMVLVPIALSVLGFLVLMGFLMLLGMLLGGG